VLVPSVKPKEEKPFKEKQLGKNGTSSEIELLVWPDPRQLVWSDPLPIVEVRPPQRRRLIQSRVVLQALE
jgi:hypothetical protein